MENMMNITTSPVTQLQRFHVADYVIFVLMLAVSVCIGIYYACSGGKQRTATEYLVGNRNMGRIPIAMSLTASFMSSIAMLGMPSEVYTYGVGYFYVIMGLILTMPAVVWLFLPVFYELQMTSTNEYIERRFNKPMRYLSSGLFIITMVSYAAFVIYGPAISLRQVTGINIWYSILTIGVVGTFYTSIGGIKAVMWTDVVQVTIMVLSLSVLCIKGTIDVGGLSELYYRNVEGKRLENLSFSLDPRIRYTFWSCTLAPFVGWTVVYGVYQPQVQRYLSSPTMKAAKESVWLNLPGMLLLYFLCCFTGLILYTRYWDCDPVSTKQLDAPDQITPLFVMEIMSAFPGLPGLYVAGVFSGSLSTVSSVFNSLAAVVLEDFVRQTKRWRKITEEQAATVSKCIAFSFGLLCLLMASLGDYFGSVIQSSSYITNMFSGAIFGIFCLGLFFPWATSMGTGIGVVCGLALGLWTSIGAQMNKYSPPRPPVSTEACPEFSNITILSAPKDDDVLELYKLSYQWMSSLVAGSIIISGLIASFLTGPNDVNNIDPRLLSCSTKYFMKVLYKDKYKPNRNEELDLKSGGDREAQSAFLNHNTNCTNQVIKSASC